MTKIGNIDWRPILIKAAERIEQAQNIKLVVDEAVVLEVGRLIADNLENIGLFQPNVAKIAGQVAFWIRKLKPLYVAPDSPNHFLLANERAALAVGVAICNLYKDDNSKSERLALPPRIFLDWVKSFRYHSHSPHSSMTSFELLMCSQ